MIVRGVTGHPAEGLGVKTEPVGALEAVDVEDLAPDGDAELHGLTIAVMKLGGDREGKLLHQQAVSCELAVLEESEPETIATVGAAFQ